MKDISNQYFQKYDGNNDFWDYMHIIKYYDQSVFKQLKKVIPARTKPHLGTVIEGNIFERPKSPVQRNNPSFTQPYYEKTINISNFDASTEETRSIVQIETEIPYYEGEVTASLFLDPSLYKFATGQTFFFFSLIFTLLFFDFVDFLTFFF